jgi:SagB-type dehydrogenase family enzyme
MYWGAGSQKRLVVGLVVALAVCGCGGNDEPTGTTARIGAPPVTIDLPEPRASGPLSLEEAIAGRRSQRDYTGEPLSDSCLSQLLWAAQGVTGAGGRGRAAPSAGGTYPLEVYVVSPDGVFRYQPDGHVLEQTSRADVRGPLAEAAVGQDHVAEGAAVIVIAAVFERTEQRYGDRAERYVILEAGHAAQNVLLQAVALDLAAVPVGAFKDDEVRALLDLPAEHAPLYLIPVGHPDGG